MLEMTPIFEVKEINLNDIRQYIHQTMKEGMAGFSEQATYYGAFVNGTMVGFTSIQYYANKAKFNNHYVFKEYRGRGYFVMMLELSINNAKENGVKLIEATCTKMSEKEYLKRGAEVVQQYKRYKKVHLHL